MNITDLPPEVLLTIFLHLKTKFVLSTLTQVCKLFYHLITPESTWKTRFWKLWPDKTTNNDSQYISSWKTICIQHEDFDEYWLHPEKEFDKFNVNQDFPIDSVLLMNSGDTLLCGSRDSTICIWDLKNIESLESPSELQSITISDHSGWIWNLVSDPLNNSRFCSGSWDNHVMLWDLENDVRQCNNLSLGAPPVCMSWQDDILVAGCYDKKIRLIDPRTFQVVSTLANHTRSVLCLYVNDTFIISGSEDKTLSIFERKAGKIYERIQLPSPAFSLHKWDTGYNLLRVGGRKGEVHVVDTTADLFNFVKTVPLTGHTQRITDIAEFNGALLTASADKTLQVHEPSSSSPTRCVLDEREAEITRLSSLANTLVSASSDGNISLWKVKQNLENTNVQ